MKYWRGEHVIVFPKGTWYFHTCLLCGKPLDLKGDAAKMGVGPECSRKSSASDLNRLREATLESDRARYRREVLEQGFKVE
jgi:hypothetical protein